MLETNVFEEQKPGGLFDIIEFVAASRFVAKYFVDGVECALVFHIMLYASQKRGNGRAWKGTPETRFLDYAVWGVFVICNLLLYT